MEHIVITGGIATLVINLSKHAFTLIYRHDGVADVADIDGLHITTTRQEIAKIGSYLLSIGYKERSYKERNYVINYKERN